MFLPFCVVAQNARQPLSNRYVGLGSYSANFLDVFSGIHNQAALAKLKSGGMGFYSERRFLLAELNQYSAIVAMPTTSGTFAVQGDYFGSSAYNETQLGLAYARSVSSQVDVGIKFNHQSMKVPGYGSASAINFEAGTILHLTSQLHAGFHIYNPFSSSFNKNNTEKLPSIIKTGLGYEASDKVFVSVEVVKQQDQPVNINAGLQYNLHEKVLLRAGIATATNSSFAGVGLLFGKMRLDLSASHHPQLGFTPGLMLIYIFNKPAEE